MQVSSIGNATAFRAQVNGQSPLVSGNWEYIQSQPQQVPTAVPTTPKKSSFWKKAFWTVATLAAVAGALAWGRSKIPANIMEKTFGTATGIKEKALWLVGKGGDFVQTGWNKVVSKISSWKAAFKKGSEKAMETAADIETQVVG